MAVNPIKISADELRDVLRHYDLGGIAKIEPFTPGNRRSPKLLLHTDRGLFLLKRRAPGRDNLAKVAYAHELQLRLRQKSFPGRHLVPTADGHATWLQLHECLYEVFEFAPGVEYDRAPQTASDVGRSLAMYHKIIAGHRSQYEPPGGSFHSHPAVVPMLQKVQANVKALTDRPPEFINNYAKGVGHLITTYQDACEKAKAIGIDRWPLQSVHGSWHPQNLVFRDQRVVAIMEFDSVRRQQRMIDLANGCLQFSTFFDRTVPPEQWPENVEDELYRQIMQGYDSVLLLSTEEAKVIPYLMIEAVNAEFATLFAGATTSEQFDKLYPWLQMGVKKSRWIRDHALELIEMVHG